MCVLHEPSLQPLSSEHLANATANREGNTLLYVKALKLDSGEVCRIQPSQPLPFTGKCAGPSEDAHALNELLVV